MEDHLFGYRYLLGKNGTSAHRASFRRKGRQLPNRQRSPAHKAGLRAYSVCPHCGLILDRISNVLRVTVSMTQPTVDTDDAQLMQTQLLEI